MSLRDRATECKTLICLLKGIQGRRTTIELRNENSVVGTIETVDARMNVNLTDARFRTLDGNETRFDQFHIRGVQIRFVHIPDDVDILKTIQSQIKQAQNIGNKGKFEKRDVKAIRRNKLNEKVEDMKRKLAHSSRQRYN